MTYYVITNGTYSDYSICAVTSDKEKAERLKVLYSDKYDEAYIEEYEEADDSDFYSKKDSTDLIFSVEKVLGPSKLSIENCFFGREDSYTYSVELNDVVDYGMYTQVYVSAKNEEEAFKKAADIFAKYEAEKEGL